MKKSPILLIGFTKFTDAGLAVKTNFITSMMDGNVLYSDAGTKLTDVNTSLSEFVKALALKGHTINYRAVKEAARKVLIADLQALGIYVRLKYPGNVANWQTSGYDVQTFDEATHAPTEPENLRAKDGQLSGECLVSYEKVPFGSYYEGRHFAVGQPIPADYTASSKTSKMLFKGLTPGTQYVFEIRARGTKGVSDWSNPVVYIVR